MKKLNTLLVTFIVTSLMLTSVADAKGGRSSGSSIGSSRSSGISIGGGSRSSGSSFSFGGGSKSSSTNRALFGGGVAAGAGTAYASSKESSSKPAPIKVNRDNVMTALKDGKGAKGDAAGVLYKNFQSQNSASPIPAGKKITAAQVDQVFSPTYRQDRRKTFYGNYNPVQPTHYQEIVHVHHNSGYGMWDYLMFDSILDNIGDRQMYYHHQSDPAFQSWRNDANAACAAGDTDVCDKLKDLDREMAEYRAKGVKENPSYITPGVDPDVYESNKIDPKTLPELKLCAGTAGSDYGRYSATLSKVTKLKVTNIEANGTGDNITKMAAGNCDMFFGQDDMTNTPNLTKLLTVTQLQVGLLVCPKESGVKVSKDLTDKHTVYIGSDQTGSQFTFDQIKDKVGMSKAKVVESQSALQAVGTIKNTKDSCLFAVTSPDSPIFKELDTSGKFQAVAIPDVQGYKSVNVDKSHYKNLTQDQFVHRTGFLWLFKEGGTDTISVSNSLVTSQSWIDQNKQLADLILLERVNLQSVVQ